MIGSVLYLSFDPKMLYWFRPSVLHACAIVRTSRATGTSKRVPSQGSNPVTRSHHAPGQCCAGAKTFLRRSKTRLKIAHRYPIPVYCANATTPPALTGGIAARDLRRDKVT